MMRKTIVVVDYNTHAVPCVLDSLTGTYDVLLASFSHLPDISMPVHRVLALVLLCRKPDDEVLQSLMTLRACYMDLKIVVLSPQPMPDMIAQSVEMGANHYLDLAADDLRLAAYLQQYTEQRRTPSVWSWLLPSWLLPKRLAAMPVSAKSLPVVEPIITSISEKWEQITHPKETPPSRGIGMQAQYKHLIEVQFFGDFVVKINGKEFKPKTNGLLLAYLLFNYHRPVHKENLMTKFWGENVNDAKNCLNAAIFSLRRSLVEHTSEKTIVFQNDYYAINTAVWHIETDAEMFSKRWEKSRSLLRTQGLAATVDEFQCLNAMYKDEFLPNFNHEWAVGRRDEFREKHLQALNLLSEYFWKSKQINECIDYCLDILQVDDCVEPTHRRLMECYMLLKMKDKAVKQYKKCVESLKKLDIAPERETEKLYLSITNL
jgi:two-component SAPR family response regulator